MNSHSYGMGSESHRRGECSNSKDEVQLSHDMLVAQKRVCILEVVIICL